MECKIVYNSRKFIRLLIFFSLLIPVFATAKQIFVVDESDREPVCGAIIKVKNGTIIGMTDGNGAIKISASDLPITIRCLGYAERTLDSMVDTVAMAASTFGLSEVVVNPTDRPVLQLRCYAREYSTAIVGSDTLHMFGEYMTEYLMTEGKVKRFKGSESPRIRSRREVIRFKNDKGLDSIYKPKYAGEMLMGSVSLRLDPKTAAVPDSVMAGCKEIEMGKSGPYKTSYVVDSCLIRNTDILADYDNHHWSPVALKILGLTTDITQFVEKEMYTIDRHGQYSPRGLQMMSNTGEFHITGKFLRMIFHTKDPVTLYKEVEIYPVEALYLTVEEAKEAKKDPTHPAITRSPLAPPLSPTIHQMLSAIAD